MVVSFIRTIFLYLLIIAALRLTGKRQLGDLEPAELVLTIMISELAAVPMQDIGIPLLGGVIPIITLVSMELIISCASYKSIKLRALLCGRPSIIIDKGRVVQTEMKKARLTLDELTEALRQNGYSDINKVRYAVLETNGQLSVIPKAQDAPPTAGDLKLQPKEAELPKLIICDGRLLEHNLKDLGLDELWVEKQLKSHGAKSHKDVYLLSWDGQGSVLFEGKEAGV